MPPSHTRGGGVPGPCGPDASAGGAGPGDDEPYGGDRAGQGREVSRGQAVRTQQGRGRHRQSRRHPHQRGVALASVLRKRLRRRRLHARRGLQALRQRLQHDRPARKHHLLRLQADRGGVPRAAPVRPARRVVGDRRVARGDRGGLLRDRHGTHVGGRSRQLRVHSAVRLRHARLLAHAAPVPAAGRAGALEVDAGARRRLRTLGGRGLHARDAARPWRVADLRARAGHRRRSTRDRHRATHGAAGSTASPRTRLRRHRRHATASRQIDYEAIHHVPMLRDAWVLSLRARVETTHIGDDEAIPFFMLPALGGGSSLRGFASWRFRDRNSLLLQAEWRVLANRFLDMALFYDAGKVTARRRRPHEFHDIKKDYGLGFRLHGPIATPLRIEIAQEQRRARAGVSVKGARSDDATTMRIVRRPCAVALVCASGGRRRRHAVAAVLRRRSHQPRAREPGRVRRAPWDIGLFYDLSTTCSSRRGASRRTRARGNINTIDEVPDSSWFTNRIGARPLPVEELLRGPNLGRAAGRGALDRHPREVAGVRRRASPRRDANGETWFLSFDPPSNPEGATGAMAVANEIFWALGYNQVETFITTVDPAQIDIDPAATMRRPSGERTPLTRDDLDEVFERARRKPGRHYRAAAGAPAAGQGPRRLPLRGHAARRPQRHRPARASSRAARAARVRRVDEPDRHEGRQHARHAGHRKRPRHRQALPAGRRLDVRHRRQRPARVGRGLRVFLPGRRVAQAAVHVRLGPEPVADGAIITEYPSIGRFEGDKFDPLTWKPHAPTAAYLEMRADDAFWAARRVMAFDDEMIRAVVKTGEYSDPAAEAVSRRRADQAPRQDRRAPI